MTCRILLFLVLFAGVASPVSAQTPQSPRLSIDVQRKSSKDVRIVLEMRWMAVNDNFEERIGIGQGMAKLPGMGAYVIRDQQQTEWLISAAEGDKRSNAGRTQTITMLNGEKREFSPFGPIGATQGSDAVQATVSNDRRVIEIQLTWAKQKDGKESPPATAVAVPLGSHLLIHTQAFLASGKMAPVSRWQQFQDRIFNQTRATSWMEHQQVFLLVSPRIALPGEKQTQTVAE